MDLIIRFGAPDFYQDSFEGLDRVKVMEDFRNFDAEKGKQNDNYETLRQGFLTLLDHKRMMWQPSNTNTDLDVDIARIYSHDRSAYLAIMRIQPQGFRGERLVPPNYQINFHVILGRVIFSRRKKVKLMTKGHNLVVNSRSTYSIRCPEQEQAAYLMFEVVDKSKLINEQ